MDLVIFFWCYFFVVIIQLGISFINTKHTWIGFILPVLFWVISLFNIISPCTLESINDLGAAILIIAVIFTSVLSALLIIMYFVIRALRKKLKKRKERED